MRGAVAAVMRNHQGKWVKGNAGMMGLLVPVAAELWSIFYGLKMAWEKGNVKSVFIESDCLEAVNLINNPDPGFFLADLVDMIKALESEEWDSCAIVHVPSSSNEAATALARAYVDGEGGLVDLPRAPAFLQPMIDAERM